MHQKIGFVLITLVAQILLSLTKMSVYVHCTFIIHTMYKYINSSRSNSGGFFCDTILCITNTVCHRRMLNAQGIFTFIRARHDSKHMQQRHQKYFFSQKT